MGADASVVDDADWASVSDVARQRGVTRQAISKRVKALAGRGKLSTQGEGRNLRFHLPTFDVLTASSHDPAQDLRNRHQRSAPKQDEGSNERPVEVDKEKRQRPVPAAQDLANSSSYDAASAREKNAKAELAEMQLAQRRAELIQVKDIAPAAGEIGVKLQQIILGLKSKAGKVYAAGATGGEEATHIALSAIADEMIAQTQNAMLMLAASEAQTAE